MYGKILFPQQVGKCASLHIVFWTEAAEKKLDGTLAIRSGRNAAISGEKKGERRQIFSEDNLFSSIRCLFYDCALICSPVMIFENFNSSFGNLFTFSSFNLSVNYSMYLYHCTIYIISTEVWRYWYRCRDRLLRSRFALAKQHFPSAINMW